MNTWVENSTEVRYHYLRPAEVVARREQAPIAWVPLGTIEWHGIHMPLGSDALQAEGIAVIAARRGGGLVMPPVYFGDVRVDGAIIETLPEYHNDQIARAMRLPAENFESNRYPFSAEEQKENYHRLLLHILYQMQSLGFRACVLITGHYPLIVPARRATEDFCSREENGMTSWAFLDCEALKDRYDYAGDHAAYWETSHMISLYPDRVDLSVLPERGEPLLGIVPNRGHLPQDADAEFGFRILEEAADIAVREITRRMAHPERLRGDRPADTK